MKNLSLISSIFTPTDLTGVETTVRELHREKLPWVPCGFRTRINWGPTLTSKCQGISLEQINGITEHAVDDLTITVQSGVSLAEVQASLAKHNQWIAIDSPWDRELNSNSISSGSLGGIVAQGLSGSMRQRYMGIRDQLIGINLIRADGTFAKAGGKVVKNVAGYDLMRLLCGSWGSLAMITEMTLRTHPIKPFHSILNIKGSINSLEKLRKSLYKTNLTPEFIDWKKNHNNELELQIGLGSISKDGNIEQIKSINKLVDFHKLLATEQEWDGPHKLQENKVINSNHRDYWLIRVALLPSKIHVFLTSKIFQDLSNLLECRIAAGIGVGNIWQSNQSMNTKINSEKFLHLRSNVEALGGNLTVLNQPDSINPNIPSWQNAKSKYLIQNIKNQFDPFKQMSPGRLPGVEG